MTVFQKLMTFQRETEALGQVMGRLSWDQETVMPEGACEQRAEEMGALDGVLHGRRTDPRIGEWLEMAWELLVNRGSGGEVRGRGLLGRSFGSRTRSG